MRPPVNPFDVSTQVREALDGSQAAFAWLYRTFAPLVHSIHLGMTTRALADELTQDTFTIAFSRLNSLREAHRFGPWIGAIARRNLPRPPVNEGPITDEHDPASANAGPDEAAEAERILGSIQALPEAYRETLLLRLVQGMSGPEIAALTGLTPQSVRVNLHRGMAKLRVALGLSPSHPEVSDALAP
jgi:RNA polymerase sigma-70 factor (ECF subfamily)